MTSLLDALTDPIRHVTPDPFTVLRRENAELTSKVERLEGELREAKAAHEKTGEQRDRLAKCSLRAIEVPPVIRAGHMTVT
jgi:hypothetical protein